MLRLVFSIVSQNSLDLFFLCVCVMWRSPNLHQTLTFTFTCHDVEIVMNDEHTTSSTYNISLRVFHKYWWTLNVYIQWDRCKLIALSFIITWCHWLRFGLCVCGYIWSVHSSITIDRPNSKSLTCILASYVNCPSIISWCTLRLRLNHTISQVVDCHRWTGQSWSFVNWCFYKWKKRRIIFTIKYWERNWTNKSLRESFNYLIKLYKKILFYFDRTRIIIKLCWPISIYILFNFFLFNIH